MPIENYNYQGDYEDLLDWIVDAYPPKAYFKEGFNSWLKDVKNNFDRDGKHFSDDIEEEMKQFWLDNAFGKLGTPQEDTRTINRATTYNTIREKATFTVKDVYNYNPKRKQSSIRRELQELVKEGKLDRIRKGVYQTK